MRTPVTIYQQKIDAGDIQPDANQRPIIEKLDDIANALVKSSNRKKGVIGRFFNKKPVKGLYLWGGVGIGKTFMMDCFFNALPIKKMRLHFHQFMREVQQDLTEIQGVKNPLQVIAKNISKVAHVICFDEFFVTNITDAMILGELFRALFSEGVTLVTSSNIAPDLLYKEGLQRERFLPAIALIKAHTSVIHLGSKQDYRKADIQKAGVYYAPIDDQSEQKMNNCFVHFSYGKPASDQPITICNRKIAIIKKAGTVAWLDFDIICGRPRSQHDYLDLTKQYHTIMISGLQPIKPHEKDRILSFIYLVDILYDAHCRLIIAAHVSIDKIYTEGPSLLQFERTLSRLVEMQSENYVYPGSISENLTMI